MWRRKKELMDGGVPFTDTREMVEQEHLMLTPEADMPENPAEIWTPPLPAGVLNP